MSRATGGVLIVAAFLFGVAFGGYLIPCSDKEAQAQVARPLVLSWPAQSGDWSHGRLIADPAVVAGVYSKERLSDGTVIEPARQDAYIGAQDDERVADFVYEPARSYVTACGFWIRDPIIYWSYAVLPHVVKKW